MSRLPISFGCSTAKPGNVGAAAKEGLGLDLLVVGADKKIWF